MNLMWDSQVNNLIYVQLNKRFENSRNDFQIPQFEDSQNKTQYLFTFRDNIENVILEVKVVCYCYTQVLTIFLELLERVAIQD